MTVERLAEALTRHLEAGKPLPSLGAPYDDLVAGLIAGTLLDDERQSAVDVLAEHPELRRLLAGVDRALESEGRRRNRVVPWGRLAAAAAVLVVALASYFALRTRNAPESTDAWLAGAAASLRGESPAIFEDFEPLGPAERAERRPSIERGGLVLQAPRRAVLDGRPTFRWKAPPGATTFRVTAIDAEGRTLLTARAEGSPWPWPSDAAEVVPGTQVVWKVEADVPGQRLVGSQIFRRPTKADEARYRDGLARIPLLAPSEETASLLAAHWALRSGLLHEAAQLLEGAGASRVAEETRAWLAKALDD